MKQISETGVPDQNIIDKIIDILVLAPVESTSVQNERTYIRFIVNPAQVFPVSRMNHRLPAHAATKSDPSGQIYWEAF